MQSLPRSSKRVVLVVLIALLVALAGCNAASPGGDSAADGGGAGESARGGAGGGGGGVGSYYDSSGERVIVREADMSVEVDNFSRAFQRLRTIADRHGGFVGDRSQSSEGDWDQGSITVRVPARNFSAARDAIARLGRVENEDVRAMDFTNEYENRQDRIRQLERDRRELRQLLNQSQNASAATRLRDELEQVRNQLRELRSQQESLRQRQALSTIRVDMHEPESQKPPRNYESAFGFVDAFRDAFYGGSTAVKLVIVFFGYALPIGIALLLLGAFGTVLLLVWRRLRDRLVDVLGRDGESLMGGSGRGGPPPGPAQRADPARAPPGGGQRPSQSRQGTPDRTGSPPDSDGSGGEMPDSGNDASDERGGGTRDSGSDAADGERDDSG